MSKEPVIKAPSKTEFLESFCSTPNITKQRKFFFVLSQAIARGMKKNLC